MENVETIEAVEAARQAKIHAKRLRTLKRARKFLRLKVQTEREKKEAVTKMPPPSIVVHVRSGGGPELVIEGLTVTELVEFTRLSRGEVTR